MYIFDCIATENRVRNDLPDTTWTALAMELWRQDGDNPILVVRMIMNDYASIHTMQGKDKSKLVETAHVPYPD